ncbi:uncharacterized protein Dwil_GK22831 [Drosophila willistoni]|uniref:tRNA/rRNA methyltransferase SpoU type domain-containing protein n=1 Tax=Drosophila willistoni TaxID=7260 RepID=B4NF41_DROWI|nr:uncharacterized protein LOC6649446 [Drosophila willistoni]EDW83416.1 uncharacterized protein Dwil_GK22831 [Drosophila willistoni]
MALRGTKATTPTTTHAVVEVLENYIQNQNLLGEIAELDDMLCELVDMHKDNVVALKRVLQCIYNLLQSNSRFNVKFGQKLFHKLISVIIADSREDSAAQRLLVANVLVCVHLHTKKFRHMDNKFLLYQLFNLSSEEQPHAIQILVHLIDDFVREFGMECYAQLVTIIQNLLQSPEIERRKSAYFLMAKLLVITEREKRVGLPQHFLKILQCSEIQWSSYVTLMENLEEQQSHLVIPSLTCLLPRLHIPGGHSHENWHSWLRILYARLLQDNNILVLRWTLNYFFTRFDLRQLTGLNLLNEFLKATNRTQLFNFEGDDSLLKFKMGAFLTDNNLGLLLEHIAKVSWHCVPLHFWLCQINPDKVSKVPKRVLIELSSRVRTLQNPSLRKMAIQRVHKLFKNTIDELSLGDYMMFIDALYNSCDDFYGYDHLIDKIKKCDNIANVIARFNQRTYEIVCCFPSDFKQFCIEEFLKKLKNLPNSQHGWWRLFPLFRLSENIQVREFYFNKYNLDVSSLAEFSDLKELQSYILDKLHCESKEEKSFVLESCVDYFVERVEEWEMLANPIDLLDKGTERTVKHLAKLLCSNEKPLQDDNVLPGLIAKINNKTSCDGILDFILPYAYKFMNHKEYHGLVSDLIANRKRIASFDCFTIALIIKQLLHGETSTGDARIEAAYINAINDEIFPDELSRQMCIPHIQLCLSNEDLCCLCNKLLNINNEMSQKKLRYFENSKEHRIKMRIASSLLRINMEGRCYWSNDLWVALLEPSNQLNICYMYEALVARTLPSDDLLFEKLKGLCSLKPTQQVSLISVVYIYCDLHSNILQHRLEEIIDMLLPHTMGPHFQTRLLAQLVLYRLASQRNDLPVANAIIRSIKITLGDKLENLEEREPRLYLPQILTNYDVNALLYITNTPFDEYNNRHLYDNNIKMLRTAFKAKRKQSDTELSSLVTTTNANVQRKMNPRCDIYPKDDLATADEKATDYELIVVASLIDKLPNLGGLARTCEVFGVKTLIIATKSDVDKSDFANISMTAEKTLNIEEVKTVALGEFLIGKQSEGYKIVGAEQTAHSTSFSDFRFPKKCVLLLGHEKHGIPVDLIGFLDYAVEIPQFGMVRSLNVHVTGSLFIWEFCKQHMVKK